MSSRTRSAESVHALISNLITELNVPGFTITRDRISHVSGGEFIFKGLARNAEAIKSMFGVDVVFLEEAQTISQESLRLLTPTIREAGSYFFMCANPRSEADPFSETFLKGRMNILRQDGIYRDETHTIVRCNHSENPYFGAELEIERQKDKATLSDAEYEHVWEGEHLDVTENSIILPDHFAADAVGLADSIKLRPRAPRLWRTTSQTSGRTTRRLWYGTARLFLRSIRSPLGQLLMALIGLYSTLTITQQIPSFGTQMESVWDLLARSNGSSVLGM